MRKFCNTLRRVYMLALTACVLSVVMSSAATAQTYPLTYCGSHPCRPYMYGNELGYDATPATKNGLAWIGISGDFRSDTANDPERWNSVFPTTTLGDMEVWIADSSPPNPAGGNGVKAKVYVAWTTDIGGAFGRISEFLIWVPDTGFTSTTPYVKVINTYTTASQTFQLATSPNNNKLPLRVNRPEIFGNDGEANFLSYNSSGQSQYLGSKALAFYSTGFRWIPSSGWGFKVIPQDDGTGYYLSTPQSGQPTAAAMEVGVTLMGHGFDGTSSPYVQLNSSYVSNLNVAAKATSLGNAYPGMYLFSFVLPASVRGSASWTTPVTVTAKVKGCLTCTVSNTQTSFKVYGAFW